MNGTELFDKLLEHRKITLVVNVTQATSLRVSFIRKFKDYKEQMTALGFLDPDLETAVVSLEYDKESNRAKYFLRGKRRSTVDYTLIEDVSQ